MIDLSAAVEFSSDAWGGDDNYIRNILNEFKMKSQEMGFFDQRMTYNNYHENMEDELKAAYDETSRLEKDMRRLLTIADVLFDKVGEYEHSIAEMK